MKIEAASIKSSMIKSVAYIANTMFVEFSSGDIYRADNVPVGHLDGLSEAESAGRYYNTSMRNQFEWTRVVVAPK